MKGIPEQSICNVKSIQSAGIHSIPKAQRSIYLDLYGLSRQKERLEKEHSVLNKRNRFSKKQLDMISKKIRKLHGELCQKENGNGQTQSKKSKRALKTMSVNY